MRSDRGIKGQRDTVKSYAPLSLYPCAPASMSEVIPAILEKYAFRAKRRLALIESVAKTVQIDVMDKSMVPYRSWHNPEQAKRWAFDLKYELHLMVNDPLPIIHAWKSVPGFTRAIVHAEIPKKLGHLIKAIHELKVEVGIAISPQTPLKKILPHLEHADMVLVMGGKPGKAGQKPDAKMFEKTLKTVEKIREQFPELPIGYDINVSGMTIPKLVSSGVTRCYSGSAIFKAKSPVEAFKRLNYMAKRAKTT